MFGLFGKFDSDGLRWLWAVAPLAWVGALLMYWMRAVAFFGHAPRYLIDKDPFYYGLQWWGCDWVVFGAMILSLGMPAWLLVLLLPQMRCRSRCRVGFYGVVGLSVLAVWVVLWRDITGFVEWYVD